MDTNSKNSELLLKTIQDLKTEKAEFQKVADELFKFDFDAYEAAFQISEKNVPEEAYVRVPIYSGDCCAILMLWGVKNQAAIHDHLNYDGLIKVLKGSLTEVSYAEKNGFIEYEGEGVASEGAVFPEDLGGIHSVINNSPEVSVSLHVYRTPQTSLNGVRIFDVKNKRIAYLNEKASSCSWNLGKENYREIIQL